MSISEIFFRFVKNNPNVKGLTIFKHEFLYTGHADDTTFFLKDRKLISDLKPNKKKTFLRIKTK